MCKKYVLGRMGICLNFHANFEKVAYLVVKNILFVIKYRKASKRGAL